MELSKKALRQQLALALIQNTKGWMPTLEEENLDDLLGEPFPADGSIQDKLTFGQRVFAALLDQQVEAIVDQIDY